MENIIYSSTNAYKYKEFREDRGSTQCDICSSPLSLWGRSTKVFSDLRANVDHDHRTGFIRGLLCTSCNVTIGRVEGRKRFIKDDEWKERAIKYLHK